MGLLISKPIGKLNRISIRALLVIFKKEVIEKKLFNTLTKLAWGHRSRGGFSPLSHRPPAPLPAGLLSSSHSLARTLAWVTRPAWCSTGWPPPRLPPRGCVPLNCFPAQYLLFYLWKKRLSSTIHVGAGRCEAVISRKCWAPRVRHVKRLEAWQLSFS